MLRFFVARSRGRELSASPADWRAVVGQVAAIFATPLPAVMAMGWDEILGWWGEADDVHAQTWGLMPSALLGR